MKLSDTPVLARERIPLVYIHSANHSGSTLLALHLARHPGVATIGELAGTINRAGPGYRCSCGAELARCPFWTEVSAAMARRGLRYRATHDYADVRNAPGRLARRLLQPLHRGPFLEIVRDLGLLPYGSYLRQHQTINAALVESIVECTGKPVMVDSSKSGIHVKYHLRNPRFAVKMIWLVRDGRGVARSLMRNQRFSMQRAAREWRRTNEEAQAIVGRLGERQWTRVRYEDLCRDPDATLRRLWAFIGVPPAALGEVEQHVLGHTTRFSASAPISLDEKWRAELSAGDLLAFEKIAGDMNRELGYTG
jgi:hypothetical protein